MDRRSLYKRLYPLATFKPGNVVYYNGAMHEVIKRFYRFSEQRVLYDLRHARTNMVVQAVPQDELISAAQHHAQQ